MPARAMHPPGLALPWGAGEQGPPGLLPCRQGIPHGWRSSTGAGLPLSAWVAGQRLAPAPRVWGSTMPVCEGGG